MSGLLTLLILGPAIVRAVGEPAVDLAVVCPQEFRAALQPLLEHRLQQGHKAAMLSNLGEPHEIRQAIRELAQTCPLKFVLLVGDADPWMQRDRITRSRSVPAYLAEAKVNVRFGSEPHIATDNYYADLDDDQTPDLAIGRLCVDSVAELAQLVDKILRYENDLRPAAWRQRVNFIAGLSGFGAISDMVLETTAKKFITEGVPAAYATSMTYASWRSPYCPAPQDFCDATVSRLNEGCLFWVYMGHGTYRGLDRISSPSGRFTILEAADIPRVNCRQGPPITLFLSCHTGAFDAARDCLAEDLLKNPGGPVAVMTGSRVTMPYGMTVLGAEMLRECFVERRATLGEVMLAAKRATVTGPRTDEQSKLLDGLAKLLNPESNIEQERREHVLLFNLLGDPLLRISLPEVAMLQVPAEAKAGTTIDVTGACDIGEGACTVELVVRRDRLTFSPPRRNETGMGLETAEYADAYRRANDHRLVSSSAKLARGKFAAKIEIPANASGECHVRVRIEGKDKTALGSSDIRVAAMSK